MTSSFCSSCTTCTKDQLLQASPCLFSIEVIFSSHFSIYENSWRFEEVQREWKQANVISVFKRGGETCNYRWASLMLTPGKILRKINKESGCGHLARSVMVAKNQHAFLKNMTGHTVLSPMTE